MCGGHINTTTLAPSPYLQHDGTPASVSKGFICPLGQVCQVPSFIIVLCAPLTIMQEGENPFGGLESFDTVYYATLQIVVIASLNTVSVSFLGH